MTATIPSSSALAKTKFANEVREGHLRKNPLSPIFGKFGENPIIIVDKATVKEGATHQMAFIDEISMDDWRTGDQKLSGTGTQLRFGTHNITIAKERVAIEVNNITESQLRTGIDLPDVAKNRLIRASASRVAFKMLSAMCDVTSGRTSNRALYGSSESNYNATHATALANVDSTDDLMTLDVLSLAKYKAQNQTSGRSFMSPATITAKDGTTAEKWVVLLHPIAARQIKKDPNYKNLVAYKDKPVFNVVNGGFFIGEYDDMLIYECPSFYKPTSTNPNPMVNSAAGANGIDVVQSLFLGAGAAGLAYSEVVLAESKAMVVMKTTADTDGKVRMAITTEVGDHGSDSEMGVTMMPGYKKLVDNSSGTAENFGLIHIFTAGNTN